MKTGEPYQFRHHNPRSLHGKFSESGSGSGSDTTDDVIAEVDAGRTSDPSDESSSVSSKAMVAALLKNKHGAAVARISSYATA